MNRYSGGASITGAPYQYSGGVSSTGDPYQYIGGTSMGNFTSFKAETLHKQRMRLFHSFLAGNHTQRMNILDILLDE